MTKVIDLKLPRTGQTISDPKKRIVVKWHDASITMINKNAMHEGNKRYVFIK